MCQQRHVSKPTALCINNTNAFDVVVCHLDFKSAVLRIDSDNARNSTILEVKRDGEEGWTQCLEYPSSIFFSVHTYISSGGMHNDRRAITLNSIKFFDNEDELEQEDVQDYRKSVDTNALLNFEGTAMDLLHLGNVDGVLLKDSNKGLAAYNDKLLKYNSKYAQLIGKQKSNVDAIAEIVSTLPHQDTVIALRKDIYDLNDKQKSFNSHYKDMKKMVQNFMKDPGYKEMSKRDDGIDANWAKEEREVTDFLKREEGMVSSLRNIIQS